MLPVNIRTQSESGTFGNRVTMMTAELPLAERNPRKRLQHVIETTVTDVVGPTVTADAPDALAHEGIG